eukprot:jgi/Mesen1/5516/ME000279S04725
MLQQAGRKVKDSSRKIAIAVDLSDESLYAVNWAVKNYLKPDDEVTLLHVRPTSVLYGADWGAVDATMKDDAEAAQKLENEFDAFTTARSEELARPLAEAGISYKIHIVKDHDMKERLCLEVRATNGPMAAATSRGGDRMHGLRPILLHDLPSTCHRGFGATRKAAKSRMGSVSNYCVHHCDCPMVVVRMPDSDDSGNTASANVTTSQLEPPK